MNQDVKTPPVFRITAIIAGLTGLVIFSMIIATLTTALRQAAQGHSRVLEEDYTLIPGWTHRAPEIIRELVEMNEESDGNPCVVAMSREDKPEMDERFDR